VHSNTLVRSSQYYLKIKTFGANLECHQRPNCTGHVAASGMYEHSLMGNKTNCCMSLYWNNEQHECW